MIARRVFLVCLVLLTLVGGSRLATSVPLLPAAGGEYEFYSDSSYTEQVGYWWYCCLGSPPSARWGSSTQYRVVLDHYSCSVPDESCPVPEPADECPGPWPLNPAECTPFCAY
jgi:hypothetical protein